MALLMRLVLSLVALLFLISQIDTNEHISVILQKCYGRCNEKYCNASIKCRPLNRTSKLSSSDVYFHKGIKIEASIYIEIIANKKFRTVYRQHMLKLKEELCAQFSTRSHPYFKLVMQPVNGNFFDPCPLTGHRYVKPQVYSYKHYPILPVGEWRIDVILTKNINSSIEEILRWYDFYEIKATSATEF